MIIHRPKRQQYELRLIYIHNDSYWHSFSFLVSCQNSKLFQFPIPQISELDFKHQLNVVIYILQMTTCLSTEESKQKNGICTENGKGLGVPQRFKAPKQYHLNRNCLSKHLDSCVVEATKYSLTASVQAHSTRCTNLSVPPVLDRSWRQSSVSYLVTMHSVDASQWIINHIKHFH